MNISEQVTQIIQEIAKQLGIVADKIYPILIRQAYVEGFTNLFSLMLCVVFGVVSYKIFKKTLNLCLEDETLALIFGIICIITILVSLLSFVTFCMNFTNMVTALVNPDYYIIQKIISMMK